MILIDTCGWIEWLTAGPLCLQFELYKWTTRKRSVQAALEVVAVTEQGKVVPLSTHGHSPFRR